MDGSNVDGKSETSNVSALEDRGNSLHPVLPTPGGLVHAFVYKQLKRLQYKKHFNVFVGQSLELVDDSGPAELGEGIRTLLTE